MLAPDVLYDNKMFVFVAVYYGCQGAELTQDYANSEYHRFRNPDSKNHLHVFPPSSTLHLSNIPLVAGHVLTALVITGFPRMVESPTLVLESPGKISLKVKHFSSGSNGKQAAAGKHPVHVDCCLILNTTLRIL